MQRRRTTAALACLLGVGMLAAACGSDDSGSQAATTAGGAGSTAAAAGSSSTTAGGSSGATSTTAGPEPQSLDDWQALWAKQRDAIVKRIEDNHWGKSADGKTLTGPEGWTVDLSKCPPDWSDTEGVSDTKIKIGQSIPLSGTYADYGNLGKGMEFLFGYYNDQGFFKDASGKTRKIEYTMKDDGYDAARAIPNVDEMLDSEKDFAVIGTSAPTSRSTCCSLLSDTCTCGTTLHSARACSGAAAVTSAMGVHWRPTPPSRAKVYPSAVLTNASFCRSCSDGIS
jgi:hypothetical protein